MEWLLPSLLIGSSFFSAKSAKDTNKQQMDLSQQQMEFQREMSNTAHTREVADLRNAGLNPILSANHGASSPSGSMAVLSNPYDTLANDAVNSAKQYAEQSLNKELIKTQKANQTATYAQANLSNAQAMSLVAQQPQKDFWKQIWQGAGGVLSSAKSAITFDDRRWWENEKTRYSQPVFGRRDKVNYTRG